MSPQPPSAASRPQPDPTGPRRGLVLGAGGVLGFAWAVGALSALQEAEGWDARTAEVFVGTSAGSVTAALLGSGVGVESMLNHQHGIVAAGDPQIDYDHETDSGGALPPRPKRLLPGSTSLLVRTALHPRRYPPMAAITSWLPAGRGTIAPVGRLVDGVVPRGEWAPHPDTWIVAMDYETGKRVPFGRAGSPPAALSDAVMASCAIPGWYAPITINGRRYVDGGTCSATSLDLLAGRGLDEVVVVAPMASFSYDSPQSVGGKLERRLRRLVTRRLLNESAKVRAAGTAVTLLGPTEEDLEAIGANLMDPRRRQRVLETSLRTTAAALAAGGLRRLAQAG
ncbi:MAG: patatin-like phospholipase family protein [Actinomycetota bacterium]|nr:patatin-like phospholipase family protein [Actinomycetota bacterium]